MVDIPIAILSTSITLLAGVLFTLVGILYRRLRSRIAELEDTLEDVESQLLTLTRDIDTAQTWMFGREEDETNAGVAAEITEINNRLQQVIDVLHDEESLEFDRDDIDE
jgi:predicted PurR-regulated permease PerM